MSLRLRSNRNQYELVQELRQNLKNRLKSENVIKSHLSVDRGDFCDIDPYKDCPQDIGYGATISAPHMHASALEFLSEKLVPGVKVLDIGSGSGYLTCCFSKMVGPNGRVVGVEHIPQLVEKSIENIYKNNGDLFDSGVLKIIRSDGRLGYEPNAPYDVIHVGAAVKKKIPKELIDQLAIGGPMLIPMGGKRLQEFVKVEKISETKTKKKKLVSVSFVPLTSRDEQLENG